MKLNLSPPKDPEIVRIKRATLSLATLGFLCAGVVVGMIQYSTYSLQKVKDEYDSLYNEVEEVKSIIHRTDRLWRGTEELYTNLELYRVIRQHNQQGIELIEKVKNFIPSFFRVTSIQVYPNHKNSCQIQISGVLKTYQEYADLMTSLMQMPKVETTFRLPVKLKDLEVQTQNKNDIEKIIDPVEKLTAQIALAQPSIVNPLTGYKIGTPLPPLSQEGSEVSVILVIADTPYKVPNVRFTLSGVTEQVPKKEKK